MIWILRGFFMGIPVGIERAAAVRRRRGLQPPSGTSCCRSRSRRWPRPRLFAFVEAWNEFFFALILTRQSAQTVPLAIAQFAGPVPDRVRPDDGRRPSISVAPVILLAIVFRDQIVRGFADGMTKG